MSSSKEYNGGVRFDFTFFLFLWFVSLKMCAFGGQLERHCSQAFSEKYMRLEGYVRPCCRGLKYKTINTFASDVTLTRMFSLSFGFSNGKPGWIIIMTMTKMINDSLGLLFVTLTSISLSQIPMKKKRLLYSMPAHDLSLSFAEFDFVLYGFL